MWPQYGAVVWVKKTKEQVHAALETKDTLALKGITGVASSTTNAALEALKY